MKRIASSILVLVMLLSFSALFAVAENGVTVIDGGAYVSISVGKKYTSTGTRYANSAYSDTDAAGNMLGKLTDGGKEWSKSSSYAASLKGRDIPDWFLDDCLSALKNHEMIKLLEQSGRFVMMPLYLYDHSGITMSSAPFSCPWDSGQVGWIYADCETVQKEYGEVTDETLEKTRRPTSSPMLSAFTTQ